MKVHFKKFELAWKDWAEDTVIPLRLKYFIKKELEK